MALTEATKIEEHLPVVSIVGRVNVGKSTLFNRLCDSQRAMISKKPGTTRTNNKGVCYWRGAELRLIDTGGMGGTDKDDPFADDVIGQIDRALAISDLILFVVDVTHPLNEDEQRVADKLHTSNKPVLLIVNKVDNNNLAHRVHEMRWQSLGFKEPLAVSASTGRGVGDLLDIIHDALGIIPTEAKPLDPDVIKVALIGRPNVGKSSLFNALIGDDEVIVSEIAHTTRESYDTLVEWNGQKLLFIDTAGIRKKPKVNRGLELRGVRQSFNQIEEADIVLFVLDASEAVTHQDKALAGLIEEAKKPLIVIANKWDKMEEQHEELTFLHISEFSGRYQDAAQHYLQYIHDVFRFMKFAPIIYVSAKTKKHVLRIFPKLMKVNEERQRWVDPVELDFALQRIIRRHLPTKGKGSKKPEVKSLKQVEANPPVFQLHITHKSDLHQSYVKYLERKIREKFGFEGVPLVFYIKK